jgi:hypothetical protein
MTAEIPEGTLALRAFFVMLPVTLVALLVLGVYAAARTSEQDRSRAVELAAVVGVIAMAWMAGTWMAAASGVLLRFDRMPPPFALVPLGVMTLGVWLARSRVGALLARQVPIAALVGVQSFRLPLELMMDQAARQGVMPAQMSFAGSNFDILTGLSAAMLAITMAFRPVPRWVVYAWNAGGLLLLANIVAIAILSTSPIASFGPDRLNVFVMTAPYVWLPAVMVTMALAGHLVIFRALAAGRA